MKRFTVMLLCFFLIVTSGCTIKKPGSINLLLPFIIPSEGTEVTSNGAITMTTSLEGNSFNSVILQIWKENPPTHIKDINSSSIGMQSGEYLHEQETGEFIICLKANSNMYDEYANLKVYLEKGATYTFSYNVKSMSESTVQIEDFLFAAK